MSKKFALIGAAGYVAPKHFSAINANDGELVAVHDLSDSMGRLDDYFPDCRYYPDIDRFMRFLRKVDLDYFVVCTPNFLHDYHCQLGLDVAKEVICEKPLVINPQNIPIENAHRINCILNVRNPQAERMRSELCPHGHNQAIVSYHAPRGLWYDHSWKGDVEKSGGVIMNIGIHMLDLMCWIFGQWNNFCISEADNWQIRVRVNFQMGDAYFNFSIKHDELMHGFRNLEIKTFVSDSRRKKSETLPLMSADGHKTAYYKILQNKGWHPEDTREGISLAYAIRKAIELGNIGEEVKR